jgi:lipoprotein-releasing system ATP-binding protein
LRDDPNLHAETAGVRAVAEDAPILEASGIQKAYPIPGGKLEVLRGVDLAVARGTILAIVGASGSGKSTLLNILGTLDRADSGTLAVRGRRLDTLSGAERAQFRSRSLGFVFQFHHLLPEFTAEENVMMPLLIAGEAPERARERARSALRAAGLESRWDHRPATLSGGEAQRVAVARALAPEPELVLADEPSGNLDRRAADALHEILVELAARAGQTFVVVTHNDRLAGLAHQVRTLEAGLLRASG